MVCPEWASAFHMRPWPHPLNRVRACVWLLFEGGYYFFHCGYYSSNYGKCRRNSSRTPWPCPLALACCTVTHVVMDFPRRLKIPHASIPTRSVCVYMCMFKRYTPGISFDLSFGSISGFLHSLHALMFWHVSWSPITTYSMYIQHTCTYTCTYMSVYWAYLQILSTCTCTLSYNFVTSLGLFIVWHMYSSVHTWQHMYIFYIYM